MWLLLLLFCSNIINEKLYQFRQMEFYFSLVLRIEKYFGLFVLCWWTCKCNLYLLVRIQSLFIFLEITFFFVENWIYCKNLLFYWKITQIILHSICKVFSFIHFMSMSTTLNWINFLIEIYYWIFTPYSDYFIYFYSIYSEVCSYMLSSSCYLEADLTKFYHLCIRGNIANYLIHEDKLHDLHVLDNHWYFLRNTMNVFSFSFALALNILENKFKMKIGRE